MVATPPTASRSSESNNVAAALTLNSDNNVDALDGPSTATARAAPSMLPLTEDEGETEAVGGPRMVTIPAEGTGAAAAGRGNESLLLSCPYGLYGLSETLLAYVPVVKILLAAAPGQAQYIKMDT